MTSEDVRLTVCCSVRSLASTFGFTFGATTQKTEEPVKEQLHVSDPPAKRRKLEDADAGEKEQASRYHDCERVAEVQRKAKARKRFESVEEDSEARHQVSGQDDSFLAIKKTTKGRGVSKAPKKKTAAIALPSAPSQDEPPSRRPRRQAATAAIDKVAQGFVQEERPVDKMRRNPEAEPPKRRVTRKATTTTSTQADATNHSPGLLESMKAMISARQDDRTTPEKQGASKQKKRPTKRKANAQSEAETAILNTERLPLAETTANPIIRSVSPERPPKPSGDDTSSASRQRSPARERSPIKPPMGVKDKAKGRRKPPKFAVSKDIPATQAEPDFPGDVGEASKVQHVPNLASRSESVEDSQPARSEEKLSEMVDSASSKSTEKGRPRNNAQADSDEQSQSVPPVMRKASSAKSAKGKHLGSKKTRQGAETAAESRSGSRPMDGGDDIDWLFDDSKTSKRAHPRKQEHSAKQKAARSIAELPDMDLDDLLSNIATYVPRKPGSTKRV